MRIVVLPSQHTDMLRLIHESHLGMMKYKQREMFFLANDEYKHWLPSGTAVAAPKHKTSYQPFPLVHCRCPTYHSVKKEFCSTSCKSRHFLLLVDCYSKFIKVNDLLELSTIAVVRGRDIMAYFDNWPQFNSGKFQKFCQGYDIHYFMSSPCTPPAEQRRSRMGDSSGWGGSRRKSQIRRKRSWTIAPRHYRVSIFLPHSYWWKTAKKLAFHCKETSETSAGQQIPHWLECPTANLYDQKLGVKPLLELKPGEYVKISPCTPRDIGTVASNSHPTLGMPELLGSSMRCGTNGRKYQRHRRKLSAIAYQHQQSTTDKPLEVSGQYHPPTLVRRKDHHPDKFV